MPFVRPLCTALLLVLTLLLQLSGAEAARPINVLVVTEDYDPDTIPRDNRIYNRVIAALQETLNVRGFQVYDETGVGMGITQPHRIRRRDPELLEIAGSVTPPMDAVVIFQIYASVRRGVTDIRRPEILIPGRVLNVQTRQIIATFEVGADMTFPPLPLGCDDRECLFSEVGTQARLIATDLGHVLADKMMAFTSAAAPPPAATGPATFDTIVPQEGTTASAADTCRGLPTAYELSFRDFTPDQFNRLELYLTNFSCYAHHRMVRSGRSYQNVWYETSASSALLNRNLRRALEYIGIVGNVTQSGSNKFDITNSNTR